MGCSSVTLSLTNLHPVWLLGFIIDPDRRPLSFVWVKRSSIFLDFVSQLVLRDRSSTNAFYVSESICVINPTTQLFVNNFFSSSFLIENQLAQLGMARTVVCLDSKNELFGRPMFGDVPFIPLPVILPLFGLVVHLVNHLFIFVIINCHEFPLLRILIWIIICCL